MELHFPVYYNYVVKQFAVFRKCLKQKILKKRCFIMKNNVILKVIMILGLIVILLRYGSNNREIEEV